MELKDWITLAFGFVNLVIVAILAPSVRALVALGQRVTVIETRQQDDRDTDTKTSLEIHGLRDDMKQLQLQVAKIEGAVLGHSKTASA